MTNAGVNTSESTLPLWKVRVLRISLGLLVLVSGYAFSAYSYSGPRYGFNTDQALGSVLFWSAVVYLIFSFPLRSVTISFTRYARDRVGVVSALVYAVVHLFLYSFTLEAILVRTLAPGFSVGGASVWVNTDLLSPPSGLNALLDLAYNPSLTISLPPIFGVVLSAYNFATAGVISALVATSVGIIRRIMGLYKLGRGLRVKTYAGLPALGVVLGASCCLSPPILLGLLTPAIGAVADTLGAYYITYFLFPWLAVTALYLNYRSLMKLSKAWTGACCERPKPSLG
jgi:hypothetical protein